MADGGRFTGPAAQEALAQPVATGVDVRQAAGRLGVAERTAYRYSASPAFGARVQAIRDGIASAALGVLSAAMSLAAHPFRSTSMPSARCSWTATPARTS